MKYNKSMACCPSAWLFACWLVLSPLSAAWAQSQDSVAGFELVPEQKLITGLEAIEQGAFDQALTIFSDLSKTMPEYRLAQLMQAELLAIKAGQTQTLSTQRQAHANTLAQLVDEAKVRWRQTHPQQNSAQRRQAVLSEYILKTSQEPYLVLVDAPAHRLFVYQNLENGYEQVGSFYVTLGEKGMGKQVRGDKKTPVGIYQIVKQMPDDALPELYGIGALTLNYPNSWDKKQGRTGSGIWLHGTPRSTYSRPPLSSRGCVVLSNDEMETLLFQFGLNRTTPVIIADQMPSSNALNQIESDKQAVLTRINRWLQAQSHYQVDWAKVSVYAYPGEEDLYYVSFPVQQELWVEQYWQEGVSGQWQLVYENTQAAHNVPTLSQKTP